MQSYDIIEKPHVSFTQFFPTATSRKTIEQYNQTYDADTNKIQDIFVAIRIPYSALL